MASNTGRSDQLSTAEQGQGRPSLDENTGLLSGQPRRLSQPNGQPSNSSNSNNKRPASTSKRSFLSGNGRKKIIVSLTAISGGLLIILGFALFKKIGTDPSKSLPSLISPTHNLVLSFLTTLDKNTLNTLFFFVGRSEHPRE